MQHSYIGQDALLIAAITLRLRCDYVACRRRPLDVLGHVGSQAGGEGLHLADGGHGRGSLRPGSSGPAREPGEAVGLEPGHG